MSRGGLSIVIATIPSGLALDAEIRLAKPALLYGDRVTLYSPAAMLLASAEQVAALDDDGLVEFLRLAESAIGPQAEQVADFYDQLRHKPRRSKAELQQLLGMKRLLRQMAQELQTAVVPMLEEAGAGELAPAIDAGLMDIDPLVSEFTDDQDALINAFMDKLRALLLSRDAYPLFDEQVGVLVRAGVDEGMFELGRTAKRRGKSVGLASDFIARVPVFPDASIAEILDVRNELRRPLSQFRAAVSAFSARVEAAAHDEDFAAEVDDLYIAEVAPALQEIREAVEANTYLKQLGRQAVSSVNEMIALGGGLTIGLMGFTDTPAVASVLVGAGAALSQAATSAAASHARGRDEIERNHLFLLYQAEHLLSL